MIRRAFTMRLKPGQIAEYRKYHDEIWPELVAEIERSGIATITTFEADPVLFLVSEIEDEAAWTKLWDSEIHRRWGEIMERFMDFKDGKVDSSPLREIFRLETKVGKAAPAAKRKAKAKAKPKAKAKVKAKAKAGRGGGGKKKPGRRK